MAKSAPIPKEWMPGDNWIEEAFDFPHLADGKLEISVGIVPENTNIPEIRFALKGLEHDGWYVLSEFYVK